VDRSLIIVVEEDDVSFLAIVSCPNSGPANVIISNPRAIVIRHFIVVKIWFYTVIRYNDEE
jgi:hypothetical protein